MLAILSDNAMLTQPSDTTMQPIVQLAGQSALSTLAEWVTIIALPLTIIGLVMTYLQGKKTKTAADAAQASAQQTSQKLESFQFTASLAMNIEKLKTCHTLMKENKWDEAVRHLTEARDQLITIRESLDQNSVEIIVKDELSTIKELRDSLNSDIRELYTKSRNEDDYPLNYEDIYQHISNVHEYFVAKQSQIKKK